MMISKSMENLINNNSVIRKMFEEGKILKEKYGEENVFDFSIGNPSVEVPEKVNLSIKQVVEDKDIHSYMNNSGYDDVRETIAQSINNRFETEFEKKNIIMCNGAAGGINAILRTILNPEDEVVVLVPYFMEYKNYVENYYAKIIEVGCNEDFTPKLDEFEDKITSKTKAVIINNPNNPSGIVYSENVINKISEVLTKKQKEFNSSIYIISDEPYREIVFDGIKVPFITKYYNNSLVVYSYSKSLSIPGERIGYIVVPSKAYDFENLIQGIAIAIRILGFVNAPSLMQKVVKECVDITADMCVYKKNRDLLYNGLIKTGFECVKPQGTFYLFLKSPIMDEKKFCEMAKQLNILMVPGSSFSKPGYVRLAFCTETKKIESALPRFKELYEMIKERI